jgi:hypothetical protein
MHMPLTESRKARHLVAGATILALASAVAVATAASASAAPPHGQPDFEPFVLPAGQACAGFDLSLGGIEDKRAINELHNGVLIEAGNGWNLTFTNLNNHKEIMLPSNGSVMKTTFTSSDTRTVQATGNNIVILFPTDTPAGPSTKLYTGRIVYTVAPGEVFTVQSTSGRTTDICALLA